MANGGDRGIRSWQGIDADFCSNELVDLSQDAEFVLYWETHVRARGSVNEAGRMESFHDPRQP